MAKFESMNIELVVAKIDDFFRDNSTNVQFTASDIGLAGSQLASLVDAGLIKVVGTETCWYQIGEDTMKKGERNIYESRYDAVSLKSLIINERMKTLDEKVVNTKRSAKYCADNLRNLADQMDALQRYL